MAQHILCADKIDLFLGKTSKWVNITRDTLGTIAETFEELTFGDSCLFLLMALLQLIDVER